MRAIWKGYLKFSLVTVPIKMYNAIIRRRPVQLHLLHKECNSRIRQERVCPSCNRKLSEDDLIRGYQYGKDLYVVITDEDFLKAQKESTDAIEVLKFVDDAQISPTYYSDSHYLLPDGKVALEAFAVFHRAMAETKKAALARVVMRNKEHLLSIRPYNGTLIAYTLHYHEDIEQVEKIEEAQDVQKIDVDTDSLSMARTIIENLSGDFVPEEYVDEYSATLMEIVKAKAAGQVIEMKPKLEREKVISLMDALKESVRQTEKVPKKAMAPAGKKVKAAQRRRKKA